MRFEFVGNPLVDTGICTMMAYMGVREPAALDASALRDRVLTGELARWTVRLKSVTMAFTSNGPLTNPSAKYDKEGLFTDLVAGALCPGAALSGTCDYCGTPALDFGELWNPAAARARAGTSAKVLGRDIVPLSGSSNAAQVFPSASRTVSICPRCLVAMAFLPLGCRLVKGKLALVEAVNQPLASRFIKEVVDRNERELRAGGGKVGNLGGKERPSTTLRFLCDLLERVRAQDEVDRPLYLWTFTNAGQSSECDVVPIPSAALAFLAAAIDLGYRQDIHWLCDSLSESDLLAAITLGRVPYRMWDHKAPLSLGFRLFYLNRIGGYSRRAIGTADRLATRISEGLSVKDREKIGKQVSGYDREMTQLMKRHASAMSLNGELTLGGWADLAARPREPRRLDAGAPRLVRLLAACQGIEVPLDQLEDTVTERKPHELIDMAATLYGAWYMQGRGRARFQRDLLQRFDRGELGLPWLRDVFARLAESHEGFDVEDWDRFVHDDDGRPALPELLFQMRLRLAEYYRTNTEESANP